MAQSWKISFFLKSTYTYRTFLKNCSNNIEILRPYHRSARSSASFDIFVFPKKTMSYWKFKRFSDIFFQIFSQKRELTQIVQIILISWTDIKCSACNHTHYCRRQIFKKVYTTAYRADQRFEISTFVCVREWNWNYFHWIICAQYLQTFLHHQNSQKWHRSPAIVINVIFTRWPTSAIFKIVLLAD